VLVHDAAGDTGTGETGLDSIEIAIATLRTGAALAEPDLALFHPDTFSALRRTKDSMNRFLMGNPSQEEVTSLWGIECLVSTKINPGDGILVDTTKVGYAAIREPINLRIGYAGTDFTQNILRTVAEERLNLAVERPSAICWIKNLPTAA
jgi:HK97 family phage major capsid protein